MLGTGVLGVLIINSVDAVLFTTYCPLFGALRALVALLSTIVTLAWEVVDFVLSPQLPRVAFGGALPNALADRAFAFSLATTLSLGLSGGVDIFVLAVVLVLCGIRHLVDPRRIRLMPRLLDLAPDGRLELRIRAALVGVWH